MIGVLHRNEFDDVVFGKFLALFERNDLILGAVKYKDVVSIVKVVPGSDILLFKFVQERTCYYYISVETYSSILSFL